ncbi:hypothetical protein NK718_08270 [Alsobacter sp. SYSU M60028]|uniref:Uncharacterized protein n=1 Tax=Alsobacter ponti TaxID=2962936 RepID=A0ABT1LE40_9HYPH|nr:hypothetical protein [Alsobacter ponti]MCP8938508.1 hypothetical protein [Alsobacter ponti]
MAYAFLALVILFVLGASCWTRRSDPLRRTGLGGDGARTAASDWFAPSD